MQAAAGAKIKPKIRLGQPGPQMPHFFKMELVLFICMYAYMQIGTDCLQRSLPFTLFETPRTSYLRQSPLNPPHPNFIPTPRAKANRFWQNEVQGAGDATQPPRAPRRTGASLPSHPKFPLPQLSKPRSCRIPRSPADFLHGSRISLKSFPLETAATPQPQLRSDNSLPRATSANNSQERFAFSFF